MAIKPRKTIIKKFSTLRVESYQSLTSSYSYGGDAHMSLLGWLSDAHIENGEIKYSTKNLYKLRDSSLNNDNDEAVILYCDGDGNVPLKNNNSSFAYFLKFYKVISKKEIAESGIQFGTDTAEYSNGATAAKEVLNYVGLKTSPLMAGALFDEEMDDKAGFNYDVSTEDILNNL